MSSQRDSGIRYVMMNMQVLDKFSNSLGLNSKFLEKDVRIHQLLIKISNSTYLRSNLVFKGGTCLVKAYIPHYRFSEDIDFGWRDQTGWEGASAKFTEKLCLEETKRIIGEMKKISDELGLQFNPSIDEKVDVFINSGGTRLAIHLNYNSRISGEKDRVKMEVNFLDYCIYPFVENKLESILSKLGTDAKFLFPEIDKYRQPVVLNCYSVKEIFVEKVRASLTREQYKIRDTIDMAMIQSTFNLDLYDYEEDAYEKIKFAVKRFSRYLNNLQGQPLPEIEKQLEKEMILLIIQRPKDLMPRMIEINKHLNQLKSEICKRLKTV